MFDEVHRHLAATIAALQDASMEARDPMQLSALAEAAIKLSEADVALNGIQAASNEGPMARGYFHDAERRVHYLDDMGQDAAL